MARGGLKSPVDDLSKLKYPGNQHPAEWVLDPKEVDLFYVPFFSLLSFIVNPIRPANASGGDTPAYSDEENQEGLIEWLEEQVYWKRNNVLDHVFICQDPNAMYKVIDRVKNGVLLVLNFGRFGREQASLVKDVILPYASD